MNNNEELIEEIKEIHVYLVEDDLFYDCEMDGCDDSHVVTVNGREYTWGEIKEFFPCQSFYIYCDEQFDSMKEALLAKEENEWMLAVMEAEELEAEE